MQIWRFIGWTFLAVAFVFTAAEAIAHAFAREYGVMSAYRVLEILSPEKLERMADFISFQIHPMAWDPVATSLMVLPGWLLFGIPGGLLAWKCRPKMEGDDLPDDYPHTTYEDILAAAEEADDYDTGLPSKYRDMDDFDPTISQAAEAPGEDAQRPLDVEQVLKDLRERGNKTD
ncbi:MAG: hypothetical protein HQ503_19230 [Rhodospirillales bacterium]|nr:hypothetical protein [Rhodospirillales bacterium]